MGIFGNFLYSQDTYGQRVRGDFPLTLVNTGSWEDSNGAVFAKFTLDIGIIDDRFPVGSQVVIVKGTSWYPDMPGKYGPAPEPVGYVTNDETVILSDIVVEETLADGTKVKVLKNSNAKQITERDLPPVPINSVMYVRVFVREFGEGSGGEFIPLPWEVRGSSFAVMAGNYGGIEGAINALPPTLYSGGDPYSYPNPESVTAKFMATLGFLADSIYTDGSLMIDVPSRLHPNMVMPLLTSFGLTQEEKAAFTDPLLSGRLKALLFAYRRIQASRGTAAAVGELIRVLSGYEVDVLPGVENLLATLGDSSPGGVKITPSGKAFACGYEVTGEYGTACTLPWVGGIPEWGDQWVVRLVGESDKDGFESPWIDRWDQLDIPADAVLPPRVIEPGDAWEAADPYEQYVDWLHTLAFTNVNAGSIGTRTNDSGGLLTDYCEPVIPGRRLRLRFRATTTTSAQVTPTIIFVKGDGTTQEVSGPEVSATRTWNDVELDGVGVPEGTEFVGWRIDAQAPDGVLYIGAVELRDVTLVSDDAINGVSFDGNVAFNSPAVRVDSSDIAGAESAWLTPYRNPRSVVITVHTPWVDIPDKKFLMDGTDSFDSPSVYMDGTSNEALAGVVAADVLIMNRLQQLLPDYLPHSVTARLLTSWEPEYIVRYPERRVAEPTPAPPGNKSLLTAIDNAVLPLALT